jgi:hypothetical protein
MSDKCEKCGRPNDGARDAIEAGAICTGTGGHGCMAYCAGKRVAYEELAEEYEEAAGNCVRAGDPSGAQGLQARAAHMRRLASEVPR